MIGDQAVSQMQASLRQEFEKQLKTEKLSPAEADLVGQVFDDVRIDDAPGVGLADLAVELVDVWAFAEQRAAGELKIRLRPAAGADDRGLGLDLLEIIQDDRPFLVDSIMGELAEAGFDVRAMFHPVVTIARDLQGRRISEGEGRRESIILVALAPVGEDRRDPLIDRIREVIADVRMAVADFEPMLALMRQTIAELEATFLAEKNSPVLAKWRERSGRGLEASREELQEYVNFLRWLSQDHFVFVGARTYEYPRLPNGDYAPEEPRFRAEDGLGVLRDPTRSVLRRASEPALLTSQLKSYIEASGPVVVAKSNLRSRVHRRGHSDYIGVKRYGPDGAAIGEVRFVGLFTAEAYDEAARDIPYLRRKIAQVLARSRATPSAHTEKRLRNIVETYPRDELFQVDAEQLYECAMGVLHLYDRPRVRLFVRRDPFDRFISILFFVPRDRYTSYLGERVGHRLAEAFHGRLSASYPNFDAGALARVHFIIAVTPNNHADPDVTALEREITELSRTWTDRFQAAVRMGGAPTGAVGELLARYDDAFPAGYRDHFDAAEALNDIAVIEDIGDGATMKVRAYRSPDCAGTEFRMKIYHPETAIPLADVLPILSDMGLKALTEEGFPITRRLDGGEAVTWVHDFVLDDPRGERLRFADIKAPFEDAVTAVWTGRAESDGFNRLVMELGASWREAALMRALARYRQQTGLDPSQAVQEEALRDYPGVARLILDLFKVKFDPAVGMPLESRTETAEALFGEIIAALQSVESLDADRSLRRLALLVRALKRTNFDQTAEDGQPKPYIAFKLASRELEDLPAPKPYREIFVASPKVEAVHLRFGPVARGGLRWSDRRDDFRTEVLGLVKAQQVKNAVIVPVGSKGGFYPKQLPRGGSPEAVRAEGVSAYRTFLSGALDITDNLDAEGGVIRPPAVIAHDPDDPYLVVAADKGTATFSDIANGVAEDYGFWLGDAFASGGSAGYDHKAMGITARGAWEAVKRHFRELGKDIQSEPFTCVGVGDMSGDVFGNGMLLSKATKLVAAFDHRHVFVDPNPDPAASWAERQRLFGLPRSSWADYDASKISKGGGVFARSAKEVALTPEIRALLQIEDETLTPADLIRAILKAPVELLYLGGIGTYVKAPVETNAEAGDKANDAVRIDATELRCQVVGEGANLGFTQAGRIAYARAGGRINTDAIDNSAGVDTSDHEVNIKILTGQLERAGKLDRPSRDKLLAAMTDEVAAHVLAHNYAQTLALTLQEAVAPVELEAQGRFMLRLENEGRLDRKVEGLPRAQAVADLRQAGRGLTRPELAVLTAYGKLELDAEIVASQAPDDPYFEALLVSYFPIALAPYEPEMRRHRLRREIIATRLANLIVDMAGPTFPHRLTASTGADATVLAASFEAARQAFRVQEAWDAVSALDLKAPATAQTALYQELARVLRGQTFWLARRTAEAGGPDGRSVQALIDVYQAAADALRATGLSLLSEFEQGVLRARAKAFVEAGAPEAMAERVAAYGALVLAVEIADLAREAEWPVVETARLFHVVGAAFGLDRLRAAAASIRTSDSFERVAVRGLIAELVAEQTRRARATLALAKAPTDAKSAASAERLVRAWVEPRQEAVARAQLRIAEIEAAGEAWSFAKLTIAAAALRAGGA